MKFEYDKEANAAYVDFERDLEVSEWHHSEFPHEQVVLDFDEEGNLLGVEILG